MLKEEVDFNCCEGPRDFARKIGLSTQRIREIDNEICTEESDKGNIAPGHEVSAAQQGVSDEGGARLDAALSVQTEAHERIKKVKAKAEMDDAVIRRSVIKEQEE